VVSQSATTRNR